MVKVNTEKPQINLFIEQEIFPTQNLFTNIMYLIQLSIYYLLFRNDEI